MLLQPRTTEARREPWNASFFSAFRQGTALQAPWSWISGLKDCETINFCYLSHWVCGTLLWHPWQTNTGAIIKEWQCVDCTGLALSQSTASSVSFLKCKWDHLTSRLKSFQWLLSPSIRSIRSVPESSLPFHPLQPHWALVVLQTLNTQIFTYFFYSHLN